jgi:hypothetical protein
MAPQRLEKIESGPGNGMASEASNPLDLVARVIEYEGTTQKRQCHARESGHPDLAARAGALDSRLRGNDTTLKNLIRQTASGMSISAKSLQFDDDNMWVAFGRTLGVPLVWFPRLLHASPEQREVYEIILDSLHWDALDEDISIPGLLAGIGDRTRRRSQAA